MMKYYSISSSEKNGFYISSSQNEIDEDILEYLIQSCNNHAKWRSDFEDPQKDYGFELFRHALVTQSEGDQESAIIRRSFLFEDVFKQLGGLTKDLT